MASFGEIEHLLLESAFIRSENLFYTSISLSLSLSLPFLLSSSSFSLHQIIGQGG